jgi:hypothetical protein
MAVIGTRHTILFFVVQVAEQMFTWQKIIENFILFFVLNEGPLIYLSSSPVRSYGQQSKNDYKHNVHDGKSIVALFRCFEIGIFVVAFYCN